VERKVKRIAALRRAGRMSARTGRRAVRQSGARFPGL
jgi:hypothetical protein